MIETNVVMQDYVLHSNSEVLKGTFQIFKAVCFIRVNNIYLSVHNFVLNQSANVNGNIKANIQV